jgi:hypothetical protein
MTSTTPLEILPSTRRPPRRRAFTLVPLWRRLAHLTLLGAGAGLVVASGVIHLDLWSRSYHLIPTIGPLFLLQGVTAFIVALTVLASRRFLAVTAAAGFLLATIAGYLISVNFGLFGFQDTLNAPLGTASLAVEATGTLALALAAALIPRRDRWRLPWR